MFWYTIPMHKRKALIIAEEGEERQLAIELFEAFEVDTIVANNFKHAQQALKTGDITEVVTGSLHGKWRQVVTVTRRYAGDIPITLWTANPSYDREAKHIGVRFVNKESFDLLPLVVLSEGDRVPP